MNAVRMAVESVGGTLSITSTPHVGSNLTLRLPLMLAIMPALLVRLQHETYAIPMVNILETMKIPTNLVRWIKHREVIPYRETVLPLVRLQERLGQPIASHHGRPIPVVVVEVNSRKAGLVVDDLLTQQEVVMKSMVGRLRALKGVAGATILGDGRVAMILDVASLV